MLYSSPYIAVAAFAYVAFVFFSESFNPFWASKGHSRRRWRFFRSLTLLFFVISTAAMQADSYFELPMQQLILGAVALFLLCSLYPIHRFLKVKGISENKNSPEAADKKPDLTSRKESLSPIITDNSASANVDTTKEKVEPIQDTPEISASDIHKLEIELAIPSHDIEFEDLDQTIAEAEADAEINIADLTDPEIRIVAQPVFSTSSKYPNTAAHNDTSEFLLNMVNGSSNKSSTTTFNTSPLNEALNEHGSDLDLNDAFMKILDAQNKEIEDLVRSNQSLIEIKESLVAEMTHLKSSLKNCIGVARKSIAQRDQAIEMKNSALTLATMEQKKRKMTENKSDKEVQKMENSSNELTG